MSENNEMLKIMDAMADIIDKLDTLPEECSEIIKSPTFQLMIKQSRELSNYMSGQTKEMLDLADRTNLNNGFRTIFGNPSKDN